MRLELFPNEILIECFEYLNAFDLFHSFDHLNYRFNKLIRKIQLHLNFQDFNKPIFDEICIKMLQNPDMKSQVYSLELSNKDICPQIQTFLSLFSIDEFSNLRSLTIVQIDLPTRKKIRSMLPLLPPLYYLHLDGPGFYGEIKLADIPLSQLQTLIISRLDSFVPSTHKTSSIIRLIIFECYLPTLCEIFKYAPMLKYLKICYLHNPEIKDTDAAVNDRYALHLKELIINDFRWKFEDFEMFIKQTPNLKSLTIDSSDNIDIVNAHQWEQLITSSLLHLNIFKFRFGCFSIDDVDNMIEKFKQFQTDFWQEQHHWYTEYEKGKDSAFIYTIPYISNKIRYCNHLIDNVTDLTFFHQALPENYAYYFSNITSLTLTPRHPYTNCLLTTKEIEYLKTIVNLSNLKHLWISGNDYKIESSSVLLEILKEAPQLSSLTIAAC